MRGLKLAREQTKFNLAFENLTLVYVSNWPGLRQSCDRGTGNEISIPAPIVITGMRFQSKPQSVCNFCQDFGPGIFKIFCITCTSFGNNLWNLALAYFQNCYFLNIWWYISIVRIQTPLENLTPWKTKSPPESCRFRTHPLLYKPKIINPPSLRVVWSF